jgi:hypothetical protein
VGSSKQVVGSWKQLVEACLELRTSASQTFGAQFQVQTSAGQTLRAAFQRKNQVGAVSVLKMLARRQVLLLDLLEKKAFLLRIEPVIVHDE